MWARWVLAILVGAALIAGIAILVNRVGPENSTSEAAVEAEDNRLADIAITEDEAPRFAGLPSQSEPAAALQRAVAGDIRQRIGDGRLTGPLQGVTCTVAGPSSSGRDPYRCTAHSAGIAYPFLAVVDTRRRRLAWCKVDEPSEAGAPEIPISASCRA
jgi:hypothetical protein